MNAPTFFLYNPNELSIVSYFISRLIAALDRWFTQRSPDSYRARHKSDASRSLEYDAYIRGNVRDRHS